MVDVAMASMFGIPVGSFRWDERYGIVQFEYDRRIRNGWRKSGERCDILSQFA